MNGDDNSVYACPDPYRVPDEADCEWCGKKIPYGNELCRDCWSENHKRLMQDRQDDPD